MDLLRLMHPLPYQPADGDGLALRGRFELEYWDTERDPKTGLFVPTRLLARAQTPNLIPDAAITQMFNNFFNSGTNLPNWCMGLIDNTGFSVVAATDTMASHAGWVENTSYDEPNRPAWGQGAAAAKVITNVASVIFTMSAGGPYSIRGGFLASQNTKGGTTGLLWSAGAFASGVQNILATKQAKLSYILSGAST